MKNKLFCDKVNNKDRHEKTNLINENGKCRLQICGKIFCISNLPIIWIWLIQLIFQFSICKKYVKVGMFNLIHWRCDDWFQTHISAVRWRWHLWNGKFFCWNRIEFDSQSFEGVGDELCIYFLALECDEKNTQLGIRIKKWYRKISTVKTREPRKSALSQ